MQLWVIYAFLSAFFAALVTIFGKLGLAKVDSDIATTLRSIIMAITLVIVVTGLGKLADIKQIDSKALVFIVLSGVAGAISWLFYFKALKEGNSTIVAGIDRASLVFILIMAVVFLKENISPQGVFGAILTAIGIIIMTLYK